MSERIDHVGEAKALLMAADHTVSENHRASTGEFKADILANAQVHATLALVEQKRIENLIVLAGWAADADKASVAEVLDDLRIGTAGEVWEGLGLL